MTDQVSTTCGLATSPAISVTQSCPTTTVGQGDVLTYSGIVHNSGNITLTNVVVMSNRPDESSVVFTVGLARARQFGKLHRQLQGAHQLL